MDVTRSHEGRSAPEGYKQDQIEETVVPNNVLLLSSWIQVRLPRVSSLGLQLSELLRETMRGFDREHFVR